MLLDFLQPGDTLVVTRIDRLARSMKDLQDIVHELKAEGCGLQATEQPVDTGTAAGKAFLDMLGVFAEFETNLRRERQLEGIKAAKAKGVYKGRKPSIDVAEVRRLRDEEKLGAIRDRPAARHRPGQRLSGAGDSNPAEVGDRHPAASSRLAVIGSTLQAASSSSRCDQGCLRRRLPAPWSRR